MKKSYFLFSLFFLSFNLCIGMSNEEQQAKLLIDQIADTTWFDNNDFIANLQGLEKTIHSKYPNIVNTKIENHSVLELIFQDAAENLPKVRQSIDFNTNENAKKVFTNLETFLNSKFCENLKLENNSILKFVIQKFVLYFQADNILEILLTKNTTNINPNTPYFLGDIFKDISKKYHTRIEAFLSIFSRRSLSLILNYNKYSEKTNPNAIDQDQNTLFHYTAPLSIITGNIKPLETLLKFNNYSEKINLDLKNKDGLTPLLQAWDAGLAVKQKPATLSKIFNEILKLITEQKDITFDPTIKDKTGQSIASLTAQPSKKETTQPSKKETAQQEKTYVPRGILIFLDDDETEEHPAILIDLEGAVKKEAGPIIASATLLFRLNNKYKKEAINFPANRWLLKEINTDLYLLIPYKYIEQLKITSDSVEEYSPDNISQTELLLGFKINHMQQRNIAQISKHPFRDPNKYFIKALFDEQTQKSNIFCVRSDYKENEANTIPMWSVYISGHGNIEHSIAALSIGNYGQSFKELLNFLENKINCRLFMYFSCYSAGLNTEIIYKNLNSPIQKTYNFTIITQAMSDATVTVFDASSMDFSSFFQK